MRGLRGLCLQDTPWSTIGKMCLPVYICRLFSHNVVSLNNKMAAMLVSHNLAGNKTFCHENSENTSYTFKKSDVIVQLSNLSVHVNQMNVRGCTYADPKME